MSTSIAVICLVAITWAIWPLAIVRFLVACAVILIATIYIPSAKAQGLPGAQMSILHYDKFRDTFMLAKCVEVGKASGDDFSIAYQLLVQRDPMAAKVTAAGGEALGMYLGDTLAQDLMRVVNSLQFMQGKTLDTYCQYTAIRATTR
jgi:hypothetical protein